MNLDIQQPGIETPVNQHVGEGTEARSSNARAAWLAWSLCALSVTFGVLALVLLYANRAHPLMPRSPLAPWFVPAMCMFPIVGAVVASSRPRNPIGWIYLAIGLAVFAF